MFWVFWKFFTDFFILFYKSWDFHLTVVPWVNLQIHFTEKFKISPLAPFSMWIIMVWRKFAYSASVLRTEVKCDFLAKSQVFSTDTKSSFEDHLSGSEQNQWPYQNRTNLLISILTENSKIDQKITPLPPQTWI